MFDLLWPKHCAACGNLSPRRLCGACLPRHLHQLAQAPEGVRGCFTLGPYHGPVGQTVARAKSTSDRGLFVEVGHVLADRLAPLQPTRHLSAIVPAPSAWTRRLRRGFAPAAVLAAVLSRRTGVPVVHALHQRLGPSQVGADRHRRAHNLRGRVRAHTDVPGVVLLVDDVLTTGATTEACTRELLGGRSAAVWLLTACVVRPEAGTGVRNL